MTATTTTPPTYPAEGEVFKLSFDGRLPENLPLVVFGEDERITDDEDRKLVHSGPIVTGAETRRFMLVRVGRCDNLDEVKARLAAHGKIPEGQWMHAFRTAYPIGDEHGPVGVADDSWRITPQLSTYFPRESGKPGESFLAWNGHGLGARWRWLVCVD